METRDALRSRRNVRQYTDQPIPPDDLDQILEAGRRTPSARNAQWWDLVVVTDRGRLQELSQVWRGAWHIAGAAAAIAIVVPQPADERQRDVINYDLGQLTMAMMITAADLGVGTGHASVADQDLARQILGYPSDRRCAWILGLGYPADRPLAPIRQLNRRPFDEVVHRERW
ncbi:MAG TPA: nitroreductase family protein [Acidimicrobiia bacterium]